MLRWMSALSGLYEGQSALTVVARAVVEVAGGLVERLKREAVQAGWAKWSQSLVQHMQILHHDSSVVKGHVLLPRVSTCCCWFCPAKLAHSHVPPRVWSLRLMSDIVTMQV